MTVKGSYRDARQPDLRSGSSLSAAASVRANNLAQVAAHVRRVGVASRRDIGEELRLNKGTVSSLVGELLDRGLLEEADSRANGDPGRPASLLRVDRQVHVSIVLEVLPEGGSLTGWTLAGDLVWRQEVDLGAPGSSADDTLRRVSSALTASVVDCEAAGRRITGATIAVPGLVDTARGRVVVSEPLRWRDVAVRDTVKASVPTHLEVDVARLASLATVAEWRALPDVTDLLCLYGAWAGLGAGLVVGNSLVTGKHGRAGEILFTAPGDSCNLDLNVATERAEALANGEPGAMAWLSRYCELLAPSVAGAIALVDPQAVIFGGYLSVLSPHVESQFAHVLDRALAPRPEADINLLPGQYGSTAPHVGAAALQTDRLLHPTALQRPLDPAPSRR